MNLKTNNPNTSFMRRETPANRSNLEKKVEANFEPRADEGGGKKGLVKFLDWILNFSLFAIFLGLPLFFTGTNYQGIAFEKQIYFYFWSLLALIAWASKCGYLGEMKIRKTPLDIPILVFWLSYLVATVFSIDRWHSFFGFFGDPSRGFLSITALIVVYYLVLTNFSQKLYQWLLRGIFISGFIVSVWTFLVVFGIKFLPDSLAVYFPFSLIGSLGATTIFLMMLIPLSISRIFSLQEEKAGSKLFIFLHSLFILLNLIVIFALYVYSFWLAFLIGMVIFLVFVLAKIVEPKGGWAILPMVIFVLILVFLMIGPVSLSRTNLPVSVDLPQQAAFNVARGSLGEHFFFGSGAATFGYDFSKNLPTGFDNYGVRFYQGQGMMLENISTIGAVGTALFAILILTFLGVAFFLLSRDKEKNKIKSLGLITASVILLVSILTHRTEGVILILWFLISALALAVLYQESNAEKDYLSFSLKASPKFALTLAFVYLIIFAGVAFMFVFIGKVYVADIKMGQAIRTQEVSEDGSITEIIGAININPREGRYYTRLGQEYMILTNQEMLKGEDERSVDKIRYYLSLAIQAGKRGEELMPQDIASVEALAQIYENAGLYVGDAYSLSQKEYEKAAELEKFNPDFLIKIGQLDVKLAQFKEKDEEKKTLLESAKEKYEKAVKMRPSYAVAYYNLALAQEGLGDQDKAIENMSQAFLLQRNNLNYAFNLARLYQDRGGDDDVKIAESLYKQILGVNDKELNTHFSLGMLYEKRDEKSQAIDEYQKVMDLLPEGSDQARGQLQKMIQNIRNGVPNTPENLGLVEAQPQEAAPEETINPEQSEVVEGAEGATEVPAVENAPAQ